ncbi:PAS domain-containing protein [Vibrio aquimaris]|uniref:PAS domain-containing protein n=1 Tax=Vibrio aquimaris TaxID=2587862 RepID=UPI0012686D4B|nr:PAS domain-containing protein [Vibrio aquimaris]
MHCIQGHTAVLPDLDNKLALNSYVIDDVVDLADQMSNPVMLKDSRGRYLYANQSSISLFGLSHQNEIVGLNSKELKGKVTHRWHDSFERAISDLDSFVVKKRLSGRDNMRAIPCQDGTLRVQNMIKKPMVSQLSDKVTSIFTFSENLTDEIDRLSLLSLYVDFYSSHLVAVRYFLKYLCVESLFIKTPSLREMETILRIAALGNQKSVSTQMGISTRTVEENIRKIKQTKLANEYLWSVLLELIRNERRNLKIK